MGCWDESIYGGDAALDWKEKIYEICKTKEYGGNEKQKAITKKNLLKNMSKIRKNIDVVGAEDEEDMNIGYQILGAICMHSGYDLIDSPGLKEQVIKSIEEDAWSKENGLRRNACNNYKKIVKDYDCDSPVNIETVNIFEDSEEEDDESIAKEFKEVFSLLNARVKKLLNGIKEKSGNKDFDEGYETAAQEEIDFLTDYKELVARQEMMGVLLERIKNDSIGSEPIASGGGTKTPENQSIDGGRADIAPG